MKPWENIGNGRPRLLGLPFYLSLSVLTLFVSVTFAALLLAFVPLKGPRKHPKKGQMDTYLRHKEDNFFVIIL